MFPAKMITKFDTTKIPSIAMNVLLISNLENRTGMKSPVTAIVNVKDETYNPEMAMDVAKCSDICDIMPIMLNGVLMPIVDNINMYNSTFGL